MEPKIQIQKELNDAKVRLSEIAALENEQWTDDIKAEEATLNGNMHTLMLRHRAAENAEQANVEKAAERFADTSDGAAEKLRTRAQAELGATLADIYAGRLPSGAMAEFNSELGLTNNKLSIDFILDSDSELRIRAAMALPTLTPASQQGQVVGYRFPPERFGFSGGDRPRVAEGQPWWAFISSAASSEELAKGAAVTESSATVSTVQATPEAVQSLVRIQQPDPQIWRAMEGVLRTHIRAVVTADLDKLWLRGNGGLIAETDPAIAAPTAPTDVVTWETLRDLPHDQVDGRYASAPSDVRFLVGRESVKAFDGVYKEASKDSLASGYDILRQKSGGVESAFHIPMPEASKVQQGLAIKGSGRYMVQPVWQGVEILFDNITLAGKREVKLYATMYTDFIVVDASGLARVAFKLG